MGRKYSIPWFSSAKTTAADLVQISSASTKVTKILAIHIEQSSDYGDAQAEGLRWQLSRFTTGGGAGAAITPRPLSPGDAAFAGTVLGGTEATGLTAGATLTVLIEGGMNVQGGWHWTPPPGCDWELAPSASVTLKLVTTPADAIDFEITILVEELG